MKLVNLVRGDLDWIVMKCLEKDRARRYESASGLARDIERHLRNEAVVARPPSRLYEFQRTVRRHKLGFAATGAVMLALLLGFATTAWTLVKERQARRRATTEAAKSQQVAQFLKDMLASVEPSVALGRDTVILREILDKTAERVDKDLKDQPEVEAELLHTLGEAYRRISQYQKGEALLRRAVAMRIELFGTNNLEVASTRDSLALALLGQGKANEAGTLLSNTLTLRMGLQGPEHRDIAAALSDLGQALFSQGKWAESEAVQRQALAMRKRVLGPKNAEVAASIDRLGLVLVAGGRFVEGEQAHREALAMFRELYRDFHPQVAGALHHLGLALWRQDKLDEAEGVDREALELEQTFYGKDSASTASSLNNLALLLKERGKLAEAETANREVLSLNRKVHGDLSSEAASSLNNLALVLQELGEAAEAEAFQREALTIQEKILGEHPYLASSLDNLASMLRDQGKLHEAEEREQSALDMRRKLSITKDDPAVAGSLYTLAEIYKDQGRLDEAATTQRRALDMLKKALGAGHPYIAALQLSLVDILLRQGRPDEAERLSLELLPSNLTQSSHVGDFLFTRVEFLARKSRWSQAAGTADQMVELEPQNDNGWPGAILLNATKVNTNQYRKLCRQALEAFGRTNEAVPAVRLSSACLVLPCSDFNMQGIEGLVDKAVTLGTNNLYLPSFQVCKALLEYRQGHFESANLWAAKPLSSTGHSWDDALHAQAQLILAMGRFRLNQYEGAQSSLAVANDLWAQQRLRAQNDWGPDWRDWLLAEALLIQAKELILIPQAGKGG